MSLGDQRLTRGLATLVCQIPDCDLCGARSIRTPAAVDGKTRMGPWAYMCEACFERHGCGLGWARGQRLILRPEGGE